MTSYRLQHTPESATTRYTVWQERQQIGEIRWHDMHSAVLYIGERGLWLRHDDGAEVAARGGSWFSRFAAEIKFNRRWSLHGEDGVLALARRRWHWRPTRDLLLLEPQPGASPLSAAFRRALGGELDISAGPVRIGQGRMSGWFRRSIEISWPGLDPARAAFFMYVMHQAYAKGEGAAGGGE